MTIDAGLSVFSKTFRVAVGFEVVAGHVTFGANVLVEVERSQAVTIYRLDAAGKRIACFGRIPYASLSRKSPPRGLLVAAP